MPHGERKLQYWILRAVLWTVAVLIMCGVTMPVGAALAAGRLPRNSQGRPALHSVRHHARFVASAAVQDNDTREKEFLREVIIVDLPLKL